MLRLVVWIVVPLSSTAALAVVLLSLCGSAALADPNQYLCIVEQSVGFSFDRNLKRWKPQTFLVGGKYILRRLTAQDRDPKAQSYSQYDEPKDADWAFFAFGETMPQAVCRNDYGFVCRRVIMDVKFDEKSLRFETVLHGAYTSQGFWNHKYEQNPPAPGEAKDTLNDNSYDFGIRGVIV